MKRNKSVAKVVEISKTYSSDTKKQIKELKQCVINGHKSGDILMVGVAYYYLAEAYDSIDDLHRMIINSLKAVTILQDTNEYEFIAKAYFILGKAYTNQGYDQMALVCDEIAYDIVKRHHIKGEIRIIALNNLSVSYHVMNETKKSVKCLLECIDLLKKEKDYDITDLFMYSVNLVSCYKDIDELIKAKEVLKSIKGIIDKVDFKPLVCDYYLRGAIVSYLLKDTKSANEYLDEAFSLFPNNIYPIPLYDDLCEVSIFVSENKDKERSKKIFDLMTIYLNNCSGTMENMYATRMMAHYFKEFGEYELATKYFAKHEELNERQQRELKEMQMKLHNTSRNTEAEINRLKKIMREHEELLSLEPMTKLLNRSALLKLSAEFIESAAKKKQKVGAVFIDIDFFKECNDTYGHARGDEIIKEVAHICNRQETRDIRFARYGGDEFFGITRGLTNKEVCDIAIKICQDIRNANIPNIKNPCGGILTVSIGVVNVAINDKTDTILEIANYADKAVYYAKNNGKNAIYELEYDNEATKALYNKIEF